MFTDILRDEISGLGLPKLSFMVMIVIAEVERTRPGATFSMSSSKWWSPSTSLSSIMATSTQALGEGDGANVNSCGSNTKSLWLPRKKWEHPSFQPIVGCFLYQPALGASWLVREATTLPSYPPSGSSVMMAHTVTNPASSATLWDNCSNPTKRSVK